MKKPKKAAFNFEAAYNPETPTPTNPVFSPSDMAERFARLKAEGRVPPLDAILRIIQKVKAEAADREFLRQSGITASETD
jgi:hypothetical protein